MSADPAHRRQLGKLLVEQGVLTDAQLQLALAEQEASGAPLGEILVRLGFTVGPTVGNALAEQHGGPLRTEYGLALGPAQGVGIPPGTLKSNASPAPGNANVGPLRVTGEPRQPGGTITALSAALDERTQELERVRIELAARDQHGTELAKARTDLEAVQLELTKTREAHAQKFEIALEQHRAERARAQLELVQRDELLEALKLELEQARGERVETAESEQARRELQLVLQHREAELVTVKAERARAQLELVQRDELLEALKLELEQARGERVETAESEQARRELQLVLQHREAELVTVKAERARAQLELVQRDELLEALKLELEQARGERVETAESEQARRELQLVLQHREAELVTVKTELEHVSRELVRRADDSRARDEVSLSNTRGQGEPIQALGERAGSGKEVDRRFTLAQTAIDDDPGVGRESLRDLELGMKQHKAELEAIAAELSRALDERTEHANRAHDLEEQLARALTPNDVSAAAEHGQRDLVAVARARAQRRYGRPIRTASVQESGRGDEGEHGRPLAAEPQIDAGQETQALAFAIPVWQLALFIILVSFALYVLLPISGSVAAGVVVALLGVIAVSHHRLTSRPR